MTKSYIFLVKYYIHTCKFQGKTPDFNGLKACIKSNKHVEYLSAKKRGKLVLHFRNGDSSVSVSVWFIFAFHFSKYNNLQQNMMGYKDNRLP